MSDDTTGRTSAPDPRTDWQRLRNMTDDEVRAAVLEDPDAEPTDAAFWKTARVVRPQSGARSPRRKSARLIFRPDIVFDPQNDDAVLWGDIGTAHFRLVIRRRLLLQEYGLKRYFDQAEAEAIISVHRDAFERLARNAYETGASEIIIG
ncbi:MAG: hypothetical protein JO032_12715 [Alphaproteobacteria bacterium]|nr:hypothetical protein [Alphaproteobacteria bacterium]